MHASKTPAGAAEDVSATLARATAQLRFEDLPTAVVDTAKRGILDTLGVSLAAMSAAQEDVRPVVELLRDTSAPGGIRALGTGWSLTVGDAIFWFGALSHAIDFDDYADIVHPSAPVVAAILPLAQAEPGAVSGQRALRAVAVGQDLIIRIALSLNRSLGDYGWLPAHPGTLGAAIGSAALLDLDEAGIRNTLGLALHQTAGTMQALTGTGSSFRAVREGFNARAGAVAAQLAARGMRGDADSFEGRFGLFNQFFDGDVNREFFASGIGTHLLGPRITFKPWPSAGHTHLFLTGLTQLMDDPKFRADDIESISIVGGSGMLQQQCEPRHLRVAPPHSIDAKVSIPWLMGTFITRGTLRIADFSDDGLRDPSAIAMAQKVQWKHDPSYERVADGFGPVGVAVHLKGGDVLRTRVEFNLGHPERPLSWEQIVQKFRDSVAASGVHLADGAVDQVVDAVANLETVPDVTVLTRLLTPQV